MNKEELLKHEAELISHGNISSANLSTCEAYGLSGNCGSKCPKFKDKSCEMFDDVLEKENANYKQALIDIREICNYYGIKPEENDNVTLRHILKDILQIIDKALGDDER